MASPQSKAQKDIVARVMREFKHGELRIGGDGPKVKNPKQAIAIGLREAGASNQQSAKENAKSLRQTKRREKRGETAKAERESTSRRRPAGGRREATRKDLYAEARRRQIPGRSKMSKGDLQRALA